MDCSMPGLPVHRQLPEFTQTHAHRVGDAIQPSHPLSSSCPPAFNLSQPQGLFQGVCSSHQVAKVSEFQLQHQSFQWIFRGWLDLLAVQGTLKSLLQQHSSKKSPLWLPKTPSCWWTATTPAPPQWAANPGAQAGERPNAQLHFHPSPHSSF